MDGSGLWLWKMDSVYTKDLGCMINVDIKD